MLKLFSINATLTNKISFYHLLLLLVSLPFDMFYSHLVLISYIIHTLIHLKKARLKLLLGWRLLILQSVFFVTAFSTVYSADKPAAFGEWGGHLAILAVPILFCLNPLDLKKYGQKLISGFALVCTGTILYLYADAVETIRYYHLPISTLVMPPFINHNFSEPIGIHATFFSMQLIISLAVMIKIAIKEKKSYTRLFFIACCGVLTAGIVQLGAKSTLVVTLILVNILVPWFLFTGKARLRYLAVSITFSAFAAAILMLSSAYHERFVSDLGADLAKATATEIHDGRLARWQVALSLIEKKPVEGYGAGTEIGLLQDGFFNNKLYDSYLNRLNCHNEYLSITLKSGIAGLAIYLGTLLFGLLTAFKRKDILFLTFVLIIAVVSISENLLDVDKGAFFYAVFYSFFFFTASKKNIKTPQQQPEIDLMAEMDKVQMPINSIYL